MKGKNKKNFLRTCRIVASTTDETKVVDYNRDTFDVFWGGLFKDILQRAEVEILKEYTTDDSNAWFIDIGCGYGRLLPFYYREDRRIVLVDYSPRQLAMAKERFNRDNIYFVAANAYHLPFKENVFGQALCIRILHHINRPEVFLEEVKRIMEDPGCCVITYMNSRSLLRRIAPGMHSTGRDHRKTEDAFYMTHPEYFEDVTRTMGLRIVSIRGTGFFHQISHKVALLAEVETTSITVQNVLYRIEAFLDWLLGRHKLALVQYILLKKRGRTENNVDQEYVNLDEILVCPRCKTKEVLRSERGYVCGGCGGEYPENKGIYDFRI